MGWSSQLAAWPRRAVVLASAAGIVALSLSPAPALAVSVASATSATSAISAIGSSPGDTGPGGVAINGAFGLAPAGGPDGGPPPSYFQLAVNPGQAVTATVIVANLGQRTQTLALRHALGITAGNGGSAYLPAAGRCSGPACWLTGLPSQVTLPPGYKEYVAFTVRVPLKTRPGQYLSGIAAAPAVRPRPVSLGGNGASSAQAIVLDAVTIGVAITVGDRSSLVSRLSVHHVQGVAEGPVARLNIGLYNNGQTFAKGTGRASCQAGRQWKSYPIYAGTVLPNDHALIAVNAPGLPEGATMPCTVRIRYAQDHVVSWSGPVTVPGAPAGRVVHDGNGAYTLISSNGIPSWGVALIIIGLLILAGICFLLYRQQRPRWR
ncbi:MAG TPA: DUF916 domain-containing protein [Trebonia sp.]|nr:DUF916 domain-containing protein [Trebonia sp.]